MKDLKTHYSPPTWGFTPVCRHPGGYLVIDIPGRVTCLLCIAWMEKHEPEAAKKALMEASSISTGGG